MAAASLHNYVFLDSEECHERLPSALVPSMIRWWEALGAPEVATWHQKYRVDWGATDDRNGGAQRTVWEIVMEMERFKYRAGEEDLEAVALVPDLAKACERVSLPVEWTHSSASQEDLACALWVLRAPEASAV